MEVVRRFVLVVVALALVAPGCGSSSGGGMTGDEVVALCDEIIAEVEGGATPAQLAALEQVVLTVAGYGYVPPPPPVGDPYALEPTGASQLYRMYGAVALLQGTLTLARWASAHAAREAPADPAALAQLAVTLLEQGRCAEAQGLLERARAQEVDRDELLRLTLATAYACQGKTGEAVAAVEEAAELAPERDVVRQAQRSLYEPDLDHLAARRSEYATTCAQDLAEALALTTTEEFGAYVMQKNQQSQALAQELVGMYMSLPPDLPGEFHVDVAAAQDAYLADYQARREGPAITELDRMQAEWEAASEAMAQTEADCCAASPEPCCGCLYGYCSDNWAYIEEHTDPDAVGVMTSYLPGAVRGLRGFEADLMGTLVRYPGASPSTAEWAGRYAYNLLATSCKTVGLQTANILQPSLMYRDWAEGYCQAAEACTDAAEAARIEEQKRRMEEARAAALEAERRKAEAAEKAQDLTLRGEVCLDSVGCLGIDGSQFSLKVGGDPVFAQFSVDVDKYEVGVRVGAGTGDPTGNLWGVDVSVGGTVGPQGTSFDVTCSQSAAAGTVKQDLTLFKSQFRF